jgi:hypothetical protein
MRGHMARSHTLRTLVLVVCSWSCSERLPVPPAGPPHPANDYVDVPYPPPPARAEIVPQAPKRGAVWVDGQWSWQLNRWLWRAGGWVFVPPGATFAPWDVYVDPDGRVRYAPATWRDAKGNVIDAPPVLESAEGETVSPGAAASCP